MSHDTDTVCIAVPPREEMSEVIRLATAAVASRTGLNLDQSDDLNTALDELFHLYVKACKTDDFCIHYSIMADRLEVLAENCSVLGNEEDRLARYSRFLLENLSDNLEERPNPKGGSDLVLVKLLTRS